MPVGRDPILCSILRASFSVPNQPGLSCVIEKAPKFIISGFIGVKLMEPSHLLEWRYGAPIVRWNTRVRVSDQEGEVKLVEESLGDDGRIARFCLCRKGEGCSLADAIDAIGVMTTVDTVSAVDVIGTIDTVSAVDVMSTIDAINAVGVMSTIYVVDTVDSTDPVGAVSCL